MKKILFAATLAALFSASCTTEKPKTEKEILIEKIENHSEALLIKECWIRDPFIFLTPEGKYMLTGTAEKDNDAEFQKDPYSQGEISNDLLLWESDNLVDWKAIEPTYNTKDNPELTSYMDMKKNKWALEVLWAPELHYYNNEWVLIHCPQSVSNLATTKTLDENSEWEFHNTEAFYDKHDPSIFVDANNDAYLLWGYYKFFIQKLKSDLSDFAGEPVTLSPSDRTMGHEGSTMYKIGDKYVYVGTAWSTDNMRKGSYNLYYCTADSPTGPFGERRFMGRFLGHGTPFIDKNGNWWCTAFYNANVEPLDTTDIDTKDLSQDAQTINKMGVTIVPLEVEQLTDGDVYMKAKAPHYNVIGADEADGENLIKRDSILQTLRKK